MRKYIWIILFCPFTLFSQVKKLADGQYQISGTTLSKLDQAAKQSIRCSFGIDSLSEQLEILHENRVVKDNIMISQQVRILRLSNDLLGEMQEREKLKTENTKLKTQLKLEKNSAIKWKISTGVAIIVATLLLAR